MNELGADDRNLTDDEVLAQQKAEERRKAATNLIHSVYRVIKACMLHSDTNQAVITLLPQAVAAVGELCQASQTEGAAILFARETVFVGAQILRASRETYATAQELGSFLETIGATELVIDRNITPPQMGVFARSLAEAQRDRNRAAVLMEMGLEGVRLRKVVGTAGDGPLEQDDSPVARVGRIYAAAVLILRGLYQDLRRGEYKLPQRVKRVAQKLVSLAEEDPRILVALSTAPSAEGDVATLAVNTAILCLMITRQLTSDRMTLATITMTALLYDAGRARLTTSNYAGATAVARVLNEEEQDALPSSAVVALTALGRLHGPSLPRAVIAYEATYLQRAGRLGPPYRGIRQPTPLARILATARTFAELRVPVKGGTPLRLEDVIQLLMSRASDATERTFVKLLVGALGFFPTGTLVELNTGEMGVVMASPERPIDFARPPVRILYDEGGNLLDAPFDLDLSRPVRAGEPRRLIRRPIDADDRQMAAMRAFALAAVAPKPKQSAPSAMSNMLDPGRMTSRASVERSSRSQQMRAEQSHPRAEPAPMRVEQASSRIEQNHGSGRIEPLSYEPTPAPEELLPLELAAQVRGPNVHDRDETTLTGPVEDAGQPAEELERAKRYYMESNPPPPMAPEPPPPARREERPFASDPALRPQRVARPLIPRDDPSHPPPPGPSTGSRGGVKAPPPPVAQRPLPRDLGTYSVAQPRVERISSPGTPSPPLTPAARSPRPHEAPPRAPATPVAGPVSPPSPARRTGGGSARFTETDKLLAAYLAGSAPESSRPGTGRSTAGATPRPQRPQGGTPRPYRPYQGGTPRPQRPQGATPRPRAVEPAPPPSPEPRYQAPSPPSPQPPPAAAKRPPPAFAAAPRDPAPFATPARPEPSQAPRAAVRPRAKPTVKPAAGPPTSPPAAAKPGETPAYGMRRAIPPKAAVPVIRTPLNTSPGDDDERPSVAPTRMMQWSRGGEGGGRTAPAAPPSEPAPISVPPPSRVPTRHFDWNQQQGAPDLEPGFDSLPPVSEPAPPSRDPTRAFQWAAAAPTAPPPPELDPISEPPPSYKPTRAIKWASTDAFLMGLETQSTPDPGKNDD